jgi:hypothetical protein
VGPLLSRAAFFEGRELVPGSIAAAATDTGGTPRGHLEPTPHRTARLDGAGVAEAFPSILPQSCRGVGQCRQKSARLVSGVRHTLGQGRDR